MHKRATVTRILLFILCAVCLASCHEDRDRELKLISFNILRTDEGDSLWNSRREGIIEMVEKEQPDVMGVQEATDHQVAWLDSVLMENYGRVGVGRDEDRHGEHTAIFYNRNRFDLIEGDTFWLSTTPEVPSKDWDARFPRIVTWVKLANNYSGEDIFVFNTHFDHRGHQARIESSKLIVNKIKEIAGEEAPAFVMGDFNIHPDDKALMPLSQYMTCARTYSPVTDEVASFHSFGTMFSTLDYIFMRNAAPDTFQTITDGYGVEYLSDHFPIRATVMY